MLMKLALGVSIPPVNYQPAWMKRAKLNIEETGQSLRMGKLSKQQVLNSY